MNKETLRMQMLAGIITESQYKAQLNENAPDWQDYEGYELLLQSYFDTYGLEDPQEFKDEVYDNGNGDAINNLAMDIAKRTGFKGSYMDLINNDDFNRYCNILAKDFLLQFAVDMGVIDRNDSEYQKELRDNNELMDSYEDKYDNISTKSFD
jgi:hypothetical protein